MVYSANDLFCINTFAVSLSTFCFSCAYIYIYICICAYQFLGQFSNPTTIKSFKKVIVSPIDIVLSKLPAKMFLFVMTVAVLFTTSSASNRVCGSKLKHTLTVNQSQCTYLSPRCSTAVFCRLEEAFRCIKSSTELIISDIELFTSVTITNRSDICIRSDSNISKIVCNNSRNTSITFKSIHNLCLINIAIERCGNVPPINFTFDDDSVFYGALLINKSTNITLDNVHIKNSIGGGVRIEDTSNEILIQKSSFTENPIMELDSASHRDKVRYGGGLYVKLDTSSQYSIFHLEKCVFQNNKITKTDSVPKFDPKHTTFGGGAYFNVRASDVYINIAESKFEGNQAGYGGGLSILFRDCAYNNTVNIYNTTFNSNNVNGPFVQFGGAFLLMMTPPTVNNTSCMTNFHTELNNVTFQENKAWIGGGAAFLASRINTNDITSRRSSIKIKNCTWSGNKAQGGAAVIFARHPEDRPSRGVLPEVNIIDSSFISNANEMTMPNENVLQGWIGQGVMSVLNVDITFSGTSIFKGNNGTGLGALDAIVIFKPITITFSFNSGWNGGAIRLYGLAYLAVDNGSEINFINNRATGQGGALYVNLVTEQAILSGSSCPIQSKTGGLLPSTWNASFNFINNTAEENGQSIYVTSLLPCQIAYTKKHDPFLSAINVFTDFPDVFHLDNESITRQVATAASKMSVETSENKVIPGLNFKLPINLTDDMNTNITDNVSLHVMIKNRNDSTITIKTSISDKTIQVIGNPRGFATLTVMTLDTPHISRSFNITLIDCPPGFFHSNTSKKCTCVNNDEGYRGLIYCHDQTFKISIRRGTWAGYVNEKVVTSRCPSSYCSYSDDSSSKTKKSLYQLPSFIDFPDNYSAVLNNFICHEKRTGVLCGYCIPGHTVYYNSPDFECQEESSLCHLGWFFYILASLVPLTFMFLIITAFGIPFTAGNLRGFLLFSQILVSMDLTGGGATVLNQNSVVVLTSIWKLLYNVLNLRFFYLDSMSFCLMKGASALDVLALQYLATIYSLILIIIVAVSLNHCAVSCNRLCKCVRFTTLKYSFVNSLAALLILCYGNCAYVSLRILNNAMLLGKNGIHNGKSRVFLQGNMIFFGSEHLPYAIPALFCLCTVITLPLFMFTVLPILHQALAKCHLENSKLGIWVCKLYLGGKLKPFYDVFQGCFKERYHFFAGLYFLYDFLILAAYPTTETYGEIVFATQAILIGILTLHCLAQPYTKPLHNSLDTLLFSNLILINGLSCYAYLSNMYHETLKSSSLFVPFFQLTLIYLPLAVLLIYVIYLLYVRSKCCKRWINYILHTNTIKQKSPSEDKENYGALQENSLGVSTESEQSWSSRRLSLNSLIAHEQELWLKDHKMF